MFRLFLINSYQSGILLKIKRKLESNMYLDYAYHFIYLFGSSHRRCSVEVSVLGGFAGFAGELLYRGLFFNKVAGLWPAALFKGMLWRGCLFLWVLRDFWERLFLQSTSWMAASVCFICDILQIFKLRKNILLDRILYITCIQFCVSYVLFQSWSCKFD